ncbi:FkbM family methyltransferase [Xanthobacter sp. V0B-10]|uniref:FkbM family methyltransferase n=1 Tax=Xanthobacter albus TaxID=3119929 RepID=UPI00372620D9
MKRDLIFDIGLHKGLDSNFYLRKGFDVVGLEAVQSLCDLASSLNKNYLDSGKFHIVNKALFYRSNETVEFYVNDEKDDWGSLFQNAAEKGVGSSRRVVVDTITLNELIDNYGVPYYIKCDIEGGDAIFAEQLLKVVEIPRFVSLEATRADDIALLRAAGYDRFQLVNQYLNPFTRVVNPPKEGGFADLTFTHEMSGLFGLELPSSHWCDFSQAIEMFVDWYNLRNRNPNLAIGWLDVHACRSENIG